MEQFLLIWLLLSLVVMLALIQVNRRIDDLVMSDYDGPEWGGLLSMSILWPIGFMFICTFLIWPWLIKER